ncbi:MAG: VTT domain-containing protein [Verrucomicrobiota bacterium]
MSASSKTQNESTIHHRRIFWIVSIAGVAAFIILFCFVDTKALHGWAEKLPGPLVFLFMAVLPVVGVPISLLFVIGGARFGIFGGMIAAAFAIAINLLLTFLMTKFVLRKPIANFFKNRQYKLPQVPKGEYAAVTLLAALVPGIPYSAKNYLLVLAGVPFRVYFFVCLPAHVFTASLGIVFGDMTKKFTPGRIAFLVAYAILILLLARRVVKRLRASGKFSSAVVTEETPEAAQP